MLAMFARAGPTATYSGTTWDFDDVFARLERVLRPDPPLRLRLPDRDASPEAPLR